ncbi:MAG TPA: zinc ribbon domain-containing protein [Candidatus Limnocylindrales bacterium]|jgi:putative FmdB family regulatory protein|nr:zinc ribbon domain-containing protein [Candidatus Limnocylindrales bacterium]
MPIYEYACTACDHRTDILHGLNDPGPTFCPSCGREGTMRKLFAPPTIHYKGSGWAKKDRGGSSGTKSSAKSSSAEGTSKQDGASSGSDSGSGSSGSSSSSSSSGSSSDGD